MNCGGMGGLEGMIVMGRPVVKSWARPTALLTSSIYCPMPSTALSSIYCPLPCTARLYNILIEPALTWLATWSCTLQSIGLQYWGGDQQPKAIRLVQGAYYAHILCLVLLCPRHRSMLTMPTYYAYYAHSRPKLCISQCTAVMRVGRWCSAVH